MFRCSMTNKDAMAAGVLQQLMGVGCHIKFSPGVVSRLGKAVHTAIGKEDYAVSCEQDQSANYNYHSTPYIGVGGYNECTSHYM